MLPTFLGIGANRSGSTWLFHNLRSHKDIFIPFKKELHFFDSEYDKGIDYYESQFSDWSGETAIGEVTPKYLVSEGAAARIKDSLPGVKLFVSLRNPVDRAYSQYWRSVARGAIPENESFEEAIETRSYILDFGNYYTHLLQYYHHFEPERLFAFRFESIKNEPFDLLSDLFAYLSVETVIDDSYTTEKINSSSSTKNLARSKSLWYLQRALNRLNMKKTMIQVEKMNRATILPMEEETRRSLENYYSEQILRTQDLVQLDLNNWLPEQ